MNTITKTISLVLIWLAAGTVTATELVQQFNSPAFSGIGYSSHVLTIEQLEATRKQKIKDDAAAAQAKAQAETEQMRADLNEQIAAHEARVKAFQDKVAALSA